MVKYQEVHSQGKEIADLLTDFASYRFQDRSWRQTVKHSNILNKILYCTIYANVYYCGALMGVYELTLKELGKKPTRI